MTGSPHSSNGVTEGVPVYELYWRNKWLTARATTIDEMMDGLRDALDELEAMKEHGVVLDYHGGAVEADCARLVTTDKKVAKRFGFDKVDQDDGEEL